MEKQTIRLFTDFASQTEVANYQSHVIPVVGDFITTTGFYRYEVVQRILSISGNQILILVREVPNRFTHPQTS